MFKGKVSFRIGFYLIPTPTLGNEFAHCFFLAFVFFFQPMPRETEEMTLVRFTCYSGGSRNFKTGGGRSRRGGILKSGVCFDVPSHIPYVFVARVVNKIHNLNIVY